MSAPSRWWVILIAFSAGAIGAGHIGKIPAALPAMRAELGLDLVAAGWVVSIFSATGMVLGTVAGVCSDRFGHSIIALGGMVLVAAGSLAGGFAWNGVSLLAARFAEGLGFLAVVVSAPSIISEAAHPDDRRLAVGMWGSFMPAGMGVTLLAAPWLLEHVGWRGTWFVMAGLSLAWVAVMAAVFRGVDGIGRTPRESAWQNLAITLKARGPWLLSLCFSFYTLSWLALMVWLPTFVVEQRGGSVALAALLTLIAVAINFPGNLLGGWLLSRGLGWARLITLGASAMVLCGPPIFLDLLPDAPRYGLCLVYSLVSGLVPAGVLGGAPYFSPGGRQIGTTNGLIIQGSHLGQFLGPPTVAVAVSLTGGWQAGAWVFVACGIGALAFAVLIGIEEKRVVVRQGSSDSSTP
ncbi:MAG: CynX/NimT family MFS transporter [Alphaproteobacteria bacterium]